MLRRLLTTMLLIAAFLGIAPASVAAAFGAGAPQADCCCPADDAGDDDAGDADAGEDAEDDDCCSTDLGSCQCGHACLAPPPAIVAWPGLDPGPSWLGRDAPRRVVRAAIPPPSPPPIG